MNSKRIILGCLVMSLVFLSCSFSSDDDPDNKAEGSSVQVLGNAHSIISGETFGASKSPTMKSIKLTALDSPPDLKIPATAYAIKNTYDKGFFIIFEIENIGSSAYSFVRIGDVFYYDNSNQALNASADSTYSYGNVGKVSNVYTNACLFPNQKG